jgi:perosamine synthetase
LLSGAPPRIVDINPFDYNIDARIAKKELTGRTKAIIVPHMFGMPTDIQELGKPRIPIIEDCAQALGVECEGRKAESFGKASVFSFYATKMVASAGRGIIMKKEL